MDTQNVYNTTREEIFTIGEKFHLDPEKLANFTVPDRIVEIKIPVKTKGGLKIFRGYRSQHNNKMGPYKGGIRFHPQVTKEEVMALSVWMSLKCAVAGLPYGGGKGGIIVDPKELSEQELETLSREYVRKIFPVIGATLDVPAPDVNTNPKIMEWMVDEYITIAHSKNENLDDNHLYAAFTGKPIDKHGLEGRTEATGFGGVVVMNELVKKLSLKPQNLTVAIQGFGNVGYYFALFSAESGFNVIALSDSKGGIVKEGMSGTLDIPLVMKCKEEKGMIAGCYCVGGVCDIKSGNVITNEELLELPVDILVPSALENVITGGNMKKIKAKIIIEMANGPITPEAYNYLTEKGVVIMPDILANSGGVSGSYIEWRQNIEGKHYIKREVLERLEKIMKVAFNNVWREKEKSKASLKEAAYLLSLRKLI